MEDSLSGDGIIAFVDAIFAAASLFAGGIAAIVCMAMAPKESSGSIPWRSVATASADFGVSSDVASVIGASIDAWTSGGPANVFPSRSMLSAKLSTLKFSGSSWPLGRSASSAAWNAGMSQRPARTLATV